MYSASLTSFLTHDTVGTQIDTVEDLKRALKEGKVRVLVEQGTAVHYGFKVTLSSVLPGDLGNTKWRPAG